MTVVTGEQSSWQESNLPGKFKRLSQLRLEQDGKNYVLGSNKCSSLGDTAFECVRALAKTIAERATT